MNIYAIGDLHLSFDKRIQKPMDVFGKRWENHDKRLQENWLNCISNEDFVIIVGDVSWGLRLDEAMADLMWIDELPGKKIITKGNHDLWWNSISKLNAISEKMTFLQNDAYLIGDTAICGTRGWICPGTDGFDMHDNKIYNRELMRLRRSLEVAKRAGADRIIASIHYPPLNDKYQPSGFTDILGEYGVDICVYGHLHGVEAFKNGFQGTLNGTKYKLVSLDYVEAMPEKIMTI